MSSPDILALTTATHSLMILIQDPTNKSIMPSLLEIYKSVSNVRHNLVTIHISKKFNKPSWEVLVKEATEVINKKI